MPRIAKTDAGEVESKKLTTAKKSSTSTSKKATTKKATKTASKKTAQSETSTQRATKSKVAPELNNTVLKETKEKSVKKSKKATTKKASSTKTSSRRVKKVSVPSLATSRRATKSEVSKSTKPIKKDDFVNILEYYDLPYRYNETVVKILAQTPKVLFVYWDISDEDRKKYEEKYGKYFFNDTYPVLIIHNKTLNYYQEVEINDFANSWYVSIPDSRSEYNVELGRRFKEYVRRNPDMPHKEDIDSVISVTYSNDLIMPNDHVLLDEIKPQVKYRNVKTNEEFYKDTKQILANNKLIDFYKLYKEIYQVEDLANVFSLTNPSSGNPTSTFK